ncbi:hypothetical protein [Bosea sp. LjRoot237]|uniref:hypothetical protein n=1 Tax=Bosea sp. LjRoot237 TaxID=3342292 RepID=UPI003ECC99E7
MTSEKKIDFADGFKEPDGVYEIVGRGDSSGVRKVQPEPQYIQLAGRGKRPVPLDSGDEADSAGRIAAAIERASGKD